MQSNYSKADRLQHIASETFQLSGDVHRLITFLNQSLKHKGFIFGLTRAETGGEFGVSIYTTGEGDRAPHLVPQNPPSPVDS